MYCQIYNQRKRKICYSEKTHSKKIRRIGTSYFSRASYSISIYHMCFAVVFPRSTVHYRLGRTSTHTSVKEIATLWLYLFFSLTRYILLYYRKVDDATVVMAVAVFLFILPAKPKFRWSSQHKERGMTR